MKGRRADELGPWQHVCRFRHPRLCKLPRNRDKAMVCWVTIAPFRQVLEAEFREASRAPSDDEFILKLGSAPPKEADESKFCLELLRKACSVTSALVLSLRASKKYPNSQN